MELPQASRSTHKRSCGADVLGRRLALLSVCLQTLLTAKKLIAVSRLENRTPNRAVSVLLSGMFIDARSGELPVSFALVLSEHGLVAKQLIQPRCCYDE